jgi:hypothetical protein
MKICCAKYPDTRINEHDSSGQIVKQLIVNNLIKVRFNDQTDAHHT